MTKKRIDVVAADPRWAAEGADWTVTVAQALGAVGLRVDHVGSTAVPGLAAKDVIDIQASLLRLDPPDEIIALMTAAGFRHHADTLADEPLLDYPCEREGQDWRKLFFSEPKGARAVHVHLRRNGSLNGRVSLLMRDFLRDDASVRRDYQAFKLALAEKVRADRDAYVRIKAPFISTVMRAAESWAELTRWVPAAPDAYWRIAE